ncbi:hypothetical protein E4U57_005812 [Claviceps arundinis]|uniref:Distal membrane-arm assembly complex protein 1-like domain-containing protein n=1 Tax=Claviceps arundinis TaxID=1623583 RepID=A0A9P7MWF5_9HYPO|nr:hypothetical protein E4U57_005812 [Claviceps arundinis]KAG5972355.1 hypothetical protein E4U56_006085 [Claviceps arundinis]
MAGDTVRNVPRDRPEDPKRPLQQDSGEDCQPCRLVGCGAFFGLAAYSYFSGTAQLEKQRQVILQRTSVDSIFHYKVLGGLLVEGMDGTYRITLNHMNMRAKSVC